MKDAHVPVAIMMAVTSLILGLLAWQIKYRKKANFISGYDPDQYRDPDGLCNWVGGTLFKTAIGGFLTAVLMLFFSSWLLVLAAIFAAIILAGTLTTAIGAGRFKAKKP